MKDGKTQSQIGMKVDQEIWSNQVLNGCSKFPVVLKTKEWVSSSSNYIKFTTQKRYTPLTHQAVFHGV